MVSGVADVPAEDGGGAQTVQRLPPPAVGARASSGAAHSASTSGGSAGYPSSRSEQHAKAATVSAPGPSASASESTFLRLNINTLDINGDDAPSLRAPTRFASPICFGFRISLFVCCRVVL
jgi:transcription factor Dp-1